MLLKAEPRGAWTLSDCDHVRWNRWPCRSWECVSCMFPGTCYPEGVTSEVMPAFCQFKNFSWCLRLLVRMERNLRIVPLKYACVRKIPAFLSLWHILPTNGYFYSYLSILGLYLLCWEKNHTEDQFWWSFVLLFSPEYNVEFFRKFILVMNALDNRGKVFLMFHILLISSSPCQSWLEI